MTLLAVHGAGFFVPTPLAHAILERSPTPPAEARAVSDTQKVPSPSLLPTLVPATGGPAPSPPPARVRPPLAPAAAPPPAARARPNPAAHGRLGDGTPGPVR